MPTARRKVKDCVRLTPRNVRRLTWLPPTCGYRLVAEGRDLYWWHPLVSGSPETVHEAGISVRGRVSGEREGRAGREAGGVYCQLAGEVAEGRAQARRQGKMRARVGAAPARVNRGRSK